MTGHVSFFNSKQMHKFFHLEFWEALMMGTAAWLASVFLPIWPFIGIAFVLVGFDHITGVRAAKRKLEAITADGFYRTVEKFCMYCIAILASKAITMVFLAGIPELPVVKKDALTFFVAFYIAKSEFKSNMENIEVVTGVRLWSGIVEKFPSFGAKK